MTQERYIALYLLYSKLRNLETEALFIDPYSKNRPTYMIHDDAVRNTFAHMDEAIGIKEAIEFRDKFYDIKAENERLISNPEELFKQNE